MRAEHWISGVRDQALSLARRRRGVEPYHGRGFDHLPSDVQEAAGEAPVRAWDRTELLRALGYSIELLLHEAEEVRDMATYLEAPFRDLMSTRWP
jgi:hypothetical protein